MRLKSSKNEPFVDILYDGFAGTFGGVLHVCVGNFGAMIEIPRFWRCHWCRGVGDWRGAYR